MTPVVDHEADTRNFSAKFTTLPASDLTCDDVMDEHARLFHGFSFIGLENAPTRGRRSSSAASATLLDAVTELTTSIRNVAV